MTTENSQEHDMRRPTTRWVTATRSGSNGGDCVEVAAQWIKASRSGSNGGQCVEVSVASGRDSTVANKEDEPLVVQVRDSKNPEGPVLTFTRSEWEAFLDGARYGEFDLDRLRSLLTT